MKLRLFALMMALLAAATSVALLARPAPRLTAARGLLPEVVILAPAPDTDTYIEEIIVRPDHLVDTGAPARDLN